MVSTVGVMGAESLGAQGCHIIVLRIHVHWDCDYTVGILNWVAAGVATSVVEGLLPFPLLY